jgi:DNA ligase 1
MDDPLLKVCETFDQIESSPGRLKKERLLKELRDDPTTTEIARELVSVACCWMRHFNLRSLPDPGRSVGQQPSLGWDEVIHLVRDLEEGYSQEYTRQGIADFFATYHPVVEKWLRRALLKDLSCGVSYTTANKVWPGCCRTFELMLAETCTNVDMIGSGEYPVAAEPKIDGVRCVAITKGDKTDFLGRSGNELYHLDHIGAMIREAGYRDCVLDGELYAGSFPETMQVVRRSVNKPNPKLWASLVFHVFDYLTLDEWEAKRCLRTYRDRQVNLDLLPTDGPLRVVPMTVVDTPEQLTSEVAMHLEQGFEGTMVKRWEGRYHFGRHKDWLKLKPTMTEDFPVVGSYEGRGRHRGRLGGLIIQLPDGQTNNVGGGFSDQQRTELWSVRDQLVGLVVEVAYKWHTPDNKLREPVLVRFREDKETNS